MTDPHGRQGIGVTQPQSGTDYPLILPSADVQYLLADLQISFDQPSDYADVPAFVPPFRIYWLSGFGTVPPDFEIPTQGSSASWNSVCVPQSSMSGSVEILDCLPLPKHDHDLIIVDSQNHVVFDSTHPLVTHETRAWGPRLQVVVWRHPTDQFVSLVYHTAWNPTDTPEPREYLSYFFPEQAVIDERSVVRLPKRLRSMTVVLDNITNEAVDLLAGYNMLLTAEEPVVDGSRSGTRIVFNAVPGAGLGIFPDCDNTPLAITTINGVGPTNTGDFFLAATDCYWFRQPTRVVTSTPLTQMPEINLSPGNIPTTGLPSEAAGTTKSATGWPTNDNPRYAHLQLGNDCQPCCDCPDYVDAALYLNETRDKYHRLGQNIEQSRDLYHEVRERWLTTLACIKRHPLRLILQAQLCPFLDVAVQFCNQSEDCQVNVELSVTFTTTPLDGLGQVMPGFTFITGAKTKNGRTTIGTDRYDMGGEWPTFTAFFDAVQPGQSVSARFRLKFADCGMLGDIPYVITGTLTATASGDPLQVDNTDTPPVKVDASTSETQTLNCPGIDTTLNYLSCACET